MAEEYFYVKKLDDRAERLIEWTELNQLKKDILWVFDENGTELHNAFVPADSFTLPYWEYLTLNSDKLLSETDKNFYREGAAIILLCMVAEYIDIPAGSQLVFGNHPINSIIQHVDLFDPANPNQEALKNILQLGLLIASTVTNEQILSNQEYDHPDMDKFYSNLPWVSKTFIIPYYSSKLE